MPAAALGTDLLTPADLAAIARVMRPQALAGAERETLFGRMVAALGLPLRQTVERLGLTQVTDTDNRTVLLLETPEPLPFSQDVTVALTLGAREVPLRVLSNGRETAALLIPVERADPNRVGTLDYLPLPGGVYRLRAALSRARWRTEPQQPGAPATYSETVDVDIVLALGLHGAAFAPDGKSFATAGDDGTARIWDAAGGKLLRNFSGHNQPVRGVAWGGDSKLLASTGDDATLRLWDATAPLPKVPAGSVPVLGTPPLAVLPDFVPGAGLAFGGGGKLLLAIDGSSQAADRSRQAVLWDVSDPRHPARRGAALKMPGDATPAALAFHPSELLAAVAAGNQILLWDVRDPSGPPQVRTLSAPAPVRSLALLAGSLLATVTVDGVVGLWDLKDTAPALKPLSLDYPADLVAAHGARLAIGSGAGIELWETEAGKSIGHIAHAGPSGLAFSDDGKRLLSTGADTAARIWDLEHGGAPLLAVRS